MAENVFISSEEIKAFQGKLIKLSDDLVELHNALENHLATLHEDWDDPKYQEFVDDFDRDKERILEISRDFEDEAKNDLQIRYEKAIEIENVNR